MHVLCGCTHELTNPHVLLRCVSNNHSSAVFASNGPWQSNPSIGSCQLVLLVRFLLAAFVRFVVGGGRIPRHDEDASVVGLQYGEPARVVVLARLVVQTPEQLRLQRTQLVLQRRRVLLQTRLLVQQFVAFTTQLQQLHARNFQLKDFRFVFQHLPEPNRACLVGVYAVTLDPQI